MKIVRQRANKLLLFLLSLLLAACATKPRVATIPVPPKPSFNSAEEHLNSARKSLERAATTAEKMDALLQAL
jgi:hypothetical protein